MLNAFEVLYTKLIKGLPAIWRVLVLLCLAAMPYLFSHLNEINIKKNEKEKIETHSEMVNYRAQISPLIDEYLATLQSKTAATRAFWVEFSNSKEGFTGMPFWYFTIFNEVTDVGIPSIARQYQQQNVSNFKYVSAIYSNKWYHISDIEDLKANNDIIAFDMFKQNNVKSAYFMRVVVNRKPIGFVGITYREACPKRAEDILASLGDIAGDIKVLFARKDMRDYTKK